MRGLQNIRSSLRLKMRQTDAFTNDIPDQQMSQNDSFEV